MKSVLLAIAIALAMVTVGNAALDVPAIDQDIFTATLGYRYICGPTVATELVAYWARNGYPNLMNGQPSGEIPDTSAAMYELFRTMLVYSGYTGTYTYPDTMRSGLARYFADKGYEAEVVLTRSTVKWADIKSELNAGRPVLILSYDLNHWLVLTEYTDGPTIYSKYVTVLCGHVPLIRTISLSTLGVFNMKAVYVRPKVITPVTEITPYNEFWYAAAKAWCDANGWEIEKAD